MAAYRFLTTWLLEAPREQVFGVLWDSERWPQWWPGVESVEKLESGDEEGRGSLGRYVWKSRLPYRVEFDARIARDHMVDGDSGRELDPARQVELDPA